MKNEFSLQEKNLSNAIYDNSSELSDDVMTKGLHETSAALESLRYQQHSWVIKSK